MRAPTRNDVARLAGTSTAVVSYVVNGGPRAVTEATRERVLRAVEELGYRPNSIARALRAQRSRILGLVMPDNANPYFAEVARQVEQRCFDRGYMLFLGNSLQDVDRQQRYIDAFIDTQVDGLIVLPREHAKAPGSSERGIPVELIVAVDNERAGYLATRHLIEHGHRRIAALAGEDGLWPATERLDGYRRALREGGLPESPVLSSRFDTDDAIRVARQLVTGSDITAVFAPTDVQGLGVIRAAAIEHRHVPQQIAVCAVDGTQAAAQSAPGLTTVREPIEALVARAIDRLLSRIEDNIEVAPTDDAPVALVRRGSCGCPDTTDL